MRPKIVTLFWAILLSLVLLACALQPAPAPSLLPSASPRWQDTVAVATPTPSPQPSSATLTPTSRSPSAAQAIEVRLHPDGELYSGDLVSFEVIAPPQGVASGAKVQLEVNGNSFGPFTFEPFGLSGRIQATFTWAWDTTGLPAGDYPLRVSLLAGESWTQTIHLQPRTALDPREAASHWATARSDCCVVHYLTNTAAERDLPHLLAQADLQARSAIEKMGIQFTDPITVTLLPRVLGHGGFTTDEIHVSYLDRNYAANDFGVVLHHEMIHLLDGRLGGGFRPSLFQEGLAVYQTGGHFKAEPLLPRAAALLDLGVYIPLTELTDNFYAAQHEVSYLEGGALIAYMVQRWGYEAFDAFYRDIELPPNGNSSQAIEAALQKHFGLKLATLENDFFAFLATQDFTPDQRQDLRLTIAYFDAVRRYQKLLDPSAYFGTAWILDSKEMRRRGIVADYFRHPARTENLALEAMFLTANQHLRRGEYASGEAILQEIQAVLDALEGGAAQPLAVSSLASDYLGIVTTLQAEGYEPQRIEIHEETAFVVASRRSLVLIPLELERTPLGWKLAKRAGRRFFWPVDHFLLSRTDVR